MLNVSSRHEFESLAVEAPYRLFDPNWISWAAAIHEVSGFSASSRVSLHTTDTRQPNHLTDLMTLQI